MFDFSRSWKRHCSWCHQKALGSCNLRVWKTSRQEKNNSTSQKQLGPCVFMAFRLQYTDARRDTRTKLPKGLKEGLYTHVFTHVFTTKYKHTSHKIVWIKLGSFCPCPDSQACAGAHWSKAATQSPIASFCCVSLRWPPKVHELFMSTQASCDLLSWHMGTQNWPRQSRQLRLIETWNGLCSYRWRLVGVIRHCVHDSPEAVV